MSFFRSVPLPFPTVIAFHRVKKSPLIIGIVDWLNNSKQLFPFSESELSHTLQIARFDIFYVCVVSFRGDRSGIINLHWFSQYFSIYSSIILVYFTLLIFFYTFFTHDIYSHPRPTTSTHYPRPTTFSYTPLPYC